MKILRSITLLLFSTVTLLFAGDFQARVVQNGESKPISLSNSLTSSIVELYESATFSQEINPMIWNEMIHSKYFIHIAFHPAVRMKLMDSKNQAAATENVEEIAIPLPDSGDPARLLYKSGSKICALAKYTPQALLHFASDPALEKFTSITRFKTELKKNGVK